MKVRHVTSLSLYNPIRPQLSVNSLESTPRSVAYGSSSTRDVSLSSMVSRRDVVGGPSQALNMKGSSGKSVLFY